MTTAELKIDLDRLLKLRLVVARFGEMDSARWWNTGDSARRTALLGRAGSLLMSRGFPKTHHFAQARVVFAVAQARSAELFDPAGCMTLWSLPAALEDQFDARWSTWLDKREDWAEFFDALQPTPDDLLGALRDRGLLEARHEAAVGKLRRSAEGRAVQLSGTPALDDDTLTLLAAAFSRGEPGKPAIPYARLEA